MLYSHRGPCRRDPVGSSHLHDGTAWCPPAMAALFSSRSCPGLCRWQTQGRLVWKWVSLAVTLESHPGSGCGCLLSALTLTIRGVLAPYSGSVVQLPSSPAPSVCPGSLFILLQTPGTSLNVFFLLQLDVPSFPISPLVLLNLYFSVLLCHSRHPLLSLSVF
jgi:hypothetical protein